MGCRSLAVSGNRLQTRSKIMRKIIINGICGGLIGLVLGEYGVSVTTWGFWVVITLVCIVIVNSILGE